MRIVATCRSLGLQLIHEITLTNVDPVLFVTFSWLVANSDAPSRPRTALNMFHRDYGMNLPRLFITGPRVVI
jgi:hypothetical protein